MGDAETIDKPKDWVGYELGTAPHGFEAEEAPSVKMELAEPTGAVRAATRDYRPEDWLGTKRDEGPPNPSKSSKNKAAPYNTTKPSSEQDGDEEVKPVVDLDSGAETQKKEETLGGDATEKGDCIEGKDDSICNNEATASVSMNQNSQMVDAESVKPLPKKTKSSTSSRSDKGNTDSTATSSTTAVKGKDATKEAPHTKETAKSNDLMPASSSYVDNSPAANPETEDVLETVEEGAPVDGVLASEAQSQIVDNSADGENQDRDFDDSRNVEKPKGWVGSKPGTAPHGFVAEEVPLVSLKVGERSGSGPVSRNASRELRPEEWLGSRKGQSTPKSPKQKVSPYNTSRTNGSSLEDGEIKDIPDIETTSGASNEEVPVDVAPKIAAEQKKESAVIENQDDNSEVKKGPVENSSEASIVESQADSKDFSAKKDERIKKKTKKSKTSTSPRSEKAPKGTKAVSEEVPKESNSPAKQDKQGMPTETAPDPKSLSANTKAVDTDSETHEESDVNAAGTTEPAKPLPPVVAKSEKKDIPWEKPEWTKNTKLRSIESEKASKVQGDESTGRNEASAKDDEEAASPIVAPDLSSLRRKLAERGDLAGPITNLPHMKDISSSEKDELTPLQRLHLAEAAEEKQSATEEQVVPTGQQVATETQESNIVKKDSPKPRPIKPLPSVVAKSDKKDIPWEKPDWTKKTTLRSSDTSQPEQEGSVAKSDALEKPDEKAVPDSNPAELKEKTEKAIVEAEASVSDDSNKVKKDSPEAKPVKPLPPVVAKSEKKDIAWEKPDWTKSPKLRSTVKSVEVTTEQSNSVESINDPIEPTEKKEDTSASNTNSDETAETVVEAQSNGEDTNEAETATTVISSSPATVTAKSEKKDIAWEKPEWTKNSKLRTTEKMEKTKLVTDESQFVDLSSLRQKLAGGDLAKPITKLPQMKSVGLSENDELTPLQRLHLAQAAKEQQSETEDDAVPTEQEEQ